MATFYNNYQNHSYNSTVARTKYNQTREDRIKDGVDYLEQNPEAKVTTITNEFGVPRNRL